MALIPFTEEQYEDIAKSRITSQFQDKTVVNKYIELLIDAFEDLQVVFKDLLQKRSIDEATGKQLDIIGEIVGQPREFIAVDLYSFFGFQGAPNAAAMGELGSLLGGQFYSVGDPLGGNILLDDPTYRLFIKAKILKNTTASTPEQFISFINFIFGTTQTFLSEGQAEYTVYFGRELSNFELTLLNYVSYSQGYPSRLIPKTVGVRINFGTFIAGDYFGFEGAPGAKGFGDLSGTYGYGLGYGLSYGDSNFGLGIPEWNPDYGGDNSYGELVVGSGSEFNGVEEYDSDTTFDSNVTISTIFHNSTPTYPEAGSVGGYFASLI